MTGGFQTSVQVQPGVAVAGDFCDHNPRYSVDAGAGGLVAGPAGLTVGLFCWATDNVVDGSGAPASTSNSGSGPVTGFVHREQQALNIQYLSDAGMTIPAGFQVAAMSAGGFWVKNDGATTALPGQKCYAAFASGKANFAAAGAPSGASGTASSIAASTNSFVGSIVGNLLTVASSVVGNIVLGTTLSGSGVATGTQVVSQLSGTAGGVGTYEVNIGEQSVAVGTAISGTYGTLTVGGTVNGVFGVGETLSGSGVVAGTAITQLLTGTGGAGTYAVNNNTVVGSTTITAALNVETSWYARSQGVPGELVKISNLPGVG